MATVDRPHHSGYTYGIRIQIVQEETLPFLSDDCSHGCVFGLDVLT